MRGSAIDLLSLEAAVAEWGPGGRYLGPFIGWRRSRVSIPKVGMTCLTHIAASAYGILKAVFLGAHAAEAMEIYLSDWRGRTSSLALQIEVFVLGFFIHNEANTRSY